MSQRRFSHKGLNVLTGWDNILKWFFLVIEDQSIPDDHIFSNLDQSDPNMTIGQIEQTLINFGITPPESLYEDLMEDRELNRGNHTVDY
jgi:hypothetical protein